MCELHLGRLEEAQTALEQALQAPPGPVVPSGLAGPGRRLQDLLADDALEVTLHEDFGYWLDGTPDPDGDVAASMDAVAVATAWHLGASRARTAGDGEP